MKQALDINGVPIKGLFKKDDGSLVVRDPETLKRSKIQKSAFMALNNEVADLREKLKTILEKLDVH